MKKKIFRKAISLLLCLGLILTSFNGMALQAKAADKNSVWKPLEDIEAAVQSEKTVAITMTTSDGSIYALPAEKATNAGPAAKLSELKEENLVCPGEEKAYGWKVTKEGEGDDVTYTFTTADGDYLYLIANNNGVRIGTKPETGYSFKLHEEENPEEGKDNYLYLTAEDPKPEARFMGVYTTTPNFRCYTSVNSNIKEQTLKFWEFDSEEEGTETPISSIKEALDAANGAEFKVKGVVTLVDGRNIYIQDETGGICLFFGTAPTDISLGDTLIAEGARAAYNGLPELSNATYEKQTEGTIPLTAKETTVEALSAADVCTYVKLSDLTVSQVSGDNVTLTDAAGKEILLYKPVGVTLEAKDVINFTGALGIFKGTLQLRNTIASEIENKGHGDDPVDPPVEGDKFGLVSTIDEGDEVILYNANSGVALGTTFSGYKINGEALTPEKGVITTDAADVVWTVGKNADGTYTFKQGDNTLGGVVSGTYNNIAISGATSVGWTLTGPDEADFHYYMALEDMVSDKGTVYLEYYNGFTLYASNTPEVKAFGINFYKKDAEPETPAGEDPVDPEVPGDVVTSLDDLKDGDTIVIYNAAHKTAASSKPNGDWYLKANEATIEEGKVKNFTVDMVWKVKVNENGTYSFYAVDDDTRSITVWPSGNYAELSVNVEKYPDNTWKITPANTENSFYVSSPTVSGTNGPAYIEAYVRNGTEVFSGYFTSRLNDTDFALKFYKVNPDDAIAAYDDGEWDGVLEPGSEYVIHNVAADKSMGLAKEATYSLNAIETAFNDAGEAIPGNGAYLFKVGSMGRYYSFEVNGKYLATNPEEELYFLDPNEDGTVPELAKWYLKKMSNEENEGYVIYNKEASYGGTPVCIEYFSSVFSGWTFSTKNDLEIYLFNFYKAADDTKVHEGVVQAPSVVFDCEDSKYVEQDYTVAASLDDLADEIKEIEITYSAGEKTGKVTEYDASSDKKTLGFTIPAADIDSEGLKSFSVTIKVTNSFDITYEGTKTVSIIDEPFFENLSPAPNAQTGEDKKPVISAKIGNVGEEPKFVMTINDEEIEDFKFESGLFSYTPEEDMKDGRTTVKITVTRKDGVEVEKSWSFTVGKSDYQLYFGQLHSHTTYSDGSGSLDTALDYIGSLPESANIQYVAFTDHSNYFDTTSAANPADAVNDKSLMTDASRALWQEYKDKVAAFNAKQSDVIAIGGFEMTWSGGPGHINTFDSDGLVSRNNAELNNKSNDAGMKLYYKTVNKGDSLNQFNHPGPTFGNFTDFSYWDEETDDHFFLVEVGNGEGQIGQGGYYPSYEQYIMALDKGWHVAPTNNQDNHKGRWGNANDARDVILTNNFSEQGIYDAIRGMHMYATEDKNLQISYTVNEQPMGTIFSDAETPETMNVEITVFDPNETDATKKVELVTTSGKVVKTWDSAADLSEGLFTAEIAPEYSYYFVRVTQEDEDLAVTAPVWVGKNVSAGIEEVKADKEIGIVNEDLTLTTTLYNGEGTAATVKSMAYTVDGSTVLGTDTTGYTIDANGKKDITFTFKPDKAKIMTITVTAVVEIDGKEFTYSKDIEVKVREQEGPLPVTDIKTVQAQTEEGYEYAIEGIVTSNASGYDKDTAFFDCIYVQDETAGICCFPVSGEYKLGDKVHIEGYTDWYQGEAELQVASIEVIGEGTVEPTEVTAAQINDLSVLGSLVTVKGTVESIEVENGLIQTIMVKDAAGDIARVFIDGYITTGKEVENCEVGAEITVTGLASYDDTFNAPDGPFPRIRIRNRADIICQSSAGPVDDPVEAAVEAINNLPSTITADDKAAVEAARAMYNALTDEEKAAFPKDVEAKLETAEAKVAAAEAQQEAAAVQSALALSEARINLKLDTFIAQMSGITAAKYTAATYEPFKTALDVAVETLAKADATLEELTTADNNLTAAQAALKAKAKNPMKVKAAAKTVKYTKVKKKKQVVAPLKVTKAEGTVTYKKTSGNKKITVNKKTGKFTVAKGTKKGSYKIKVKITAAGNGNYKKLAKSVTVTIKVK